MTSVESRPVRTLHVYSGNLFGGIEAFLLTLSRTTPGAEFALCFEGRLASQLREHGALVHRLGAVRTRRPLSILRARRRLKAILRTHAFDVVVCHSHWSQAVFGPAVRALKLPLVFYLHDVSRGKHWMERWASFTRPSFAVTNSRFTAETLHLTYPRLAQETVYLPVFPAPAITAEQRVAIRRELNTEPDATVIAQVSRLERCKGHPLLLNALAQLRDIRGWVVWIVGGAQRPHEVAYLHELQSLVNDLGLVDRVRFAGQRSDVPLLLRAADIHCQPNIDPEAFGIALVEALGAGLPVITTAIGGALEIVDASCGMIVPVNASAVADALRILLTDEERRARLAAKAPGRAKELCDPAAQSRKLADVFAGVAARTRAGVGPLNVPIAPQVSRRR